jgi:hypothetical protein
VVEHGLADRAVNEPGFVHAAVAAGREGDAEVLIVAISCLGTISGRAGM